MGLNFHQSSSPDHVIHKVKSKVKVKIKRLLKLYVPTKKVMADLESLNANGRLNVRGQACFDRNQQERACHSTKTVYRIELKFEI